MVLEIPDASAEEPCLSLGVDLGGTKIAAAVVDSSGQPLSDAVTLPTRARESRQVTLNQLYDAIDRALSAAEVKANDLAGIGIGTTGPLDPRMGVLLEPETLPALFDCPLAQLVEERFGRSVTMTNDANCFALSEAMFGRGRGEDIVLGVTLGTGCGVGVVIGGRLLEGTTANAGEMYRALVGERTYDEALSGVGVQALFAARTDRRESAPRLAELARDGDAGAVDAWRQFGAMCAQGIGALAALLDPGVVVLGGSVSGAADLFLPELTARIPDFLAPSAAARMRIEVSTDALGAGVRGAAALVFSPGRLA